MAVKIVTDSVADLPYEVVKKLGITVIPIPVRFGEKVYCDNIDLTAEQSYEKLKHSRLLPVTSVPTPATFAQVYDKLGEQTDEILARPWYNFGSRIFSSFNVKQVAVGLTLLVYWLRLGGFKIIEIG